MSSEYVGIYLCLCRFYWTLEAHNTNKSANVNHFLSNVLWVLLLTNDQLVGLKTNPSLINASLLTPQAPHLQLHIHTYAYVSGHDVELHADSYHRYRE